MVGIGQALANPFDQRFTATSGTAAPAVPSARARPRYRYRDSSQCTDNAGRYFASFVVETGPEEIRSSGSAASSPTSQVCSVCGVQDGPKPLHVRVWTCGACGTVLDRDVDAAVDVAKAAGLAVTACGAQVRRAPVPAPRSEAGTHPTPQPSTAR